MTDRAVVFFGHSHDNKTMNDVRRHRLSKMIEAIRELNHFSHDAAKMVCQDCAPSYVTRTLNQLVQFGFLDRYVSQDKQKLHIWVNGQSEKIEQWIATRIHGEQIKETPEPDRPREVLLRQGAAKLSLDQLLAILLRTGIQGESALQAARLLSNRFSDRLDSLPDASLHELKLISRAVRKDSYCQIMAGIELGRRVAALKHEKASEQVRIRGSEDAVQLCMRLFHRLAFDGRQEEFHIVTLDTQHGMLNQHLITVGTLDASLVHPREVFRPAIRDAAASVLLVHNHPSGDPTPSSEDRKVTQRLREAGDLIGIRVLDHIVVARERGISLMAGG